MYQSKILDAASEIALGPPAHVQYLHSVLCHVGFPRSATDSRCFERRSGHVHLLLEAGKVFDGSQFVERPLPYGTIPRLVMVNVSTEAVRTKTRHVDVGTSTRDFLSRLGIHPSGGVRGGYTSFRRQIEALVACRLTLGMQEEGRAVTIDAKPVERYDAWCEREAGRRATWPGTIVLTEQFFNTLCEHAVPLDPRALAALKHTALGLDIYSWLSHRLCRIRSPQGARLSWRNLYEQFGQEYGTSKDFKKKFRPALRQVLAVYPNASVQEVMGGLHLRYSTAPLAPTRVCLSGK